MAKVKCGQIIDCCTLSLVMFFDTDASIWFNCVKLYETNEPITIGKGSNIQEGSIIHTDPVF